MKTYRILMLCVMFCLAFLHGKCGMAAENAQDKEDESDVRIWKPTYGKVISAKEYWRKKRETFMKRFERKREKSGAAGGKGKGDEKEKTAEQAKQVDPSTEKTNSSPGEKSTTSEPGPEEHRKPPVGMHTRSGVISYTEFEMGSLRRLLYKQEGIRYSSTSENPRQGFSVPGLVRYVFGKLGYHAPEGPVEKIFENFGYFLPDEYGGFQTGDLLFFSLYSKKEGKARLLVAICVDGEDMAYSSYTRKKVVIRNIHDTFWREHFVAAKRALVH